jgi:hypothetical protein
MSKSRLWRVDISHIRGYQAPHIMVETSAYLRYDAEVEALQLAKGRTELSKFDCWNFTATKVDRKLFNGKWLTPQEFERAIEKVGSFNKRRKVVDD